MMKLIYNILFAVSVCVPALFLNCRVSYGEQAYSLGVVPQLTPATIEQKWEPLLRLISNRLGVKVVLKSYASIQEFESDFANGNPDFVYLNPYHATIAHQKQHYTPLIRNKENSLQGILVVAQDSGIHSVKELNGRLIVFPAPNAFAASLYLQALLHSKEQIKFRVKYVTTHSNVYRHVSLGKAAAGGGVNTTFNLESPELKKQLRILYKTPAVVSHAICAHPRVPDDVKRAVIALLIATGKDPKTAHLLKNVGIIMPVEADYDKDYSFIETWFSANLP